VARGVATDLPTATWPSQCDLYHTIDVFTRYLYLIWFLAYFFAV
jgi:hypothetical protein